MRPFYFSNPGVLPLAAITTLGLSVKGGDDPIGRFGTGLKYTIAGILRLGEEISIQTGGKVYYFHKVPEVVKGKTFYIVHMTEMDKEGVERDHALGFTTELGKHWEPWMFVRELWSNMRDEKGEHGWLREVSIRPVDHTLIIVAGPIMEATYADIDSYILSSTPFKVLDNVEFHLPKDSNQTIYYQGVKVGRFEKPYRYTLNITGWLDLTEDRTITSPWYAIASASKVILTSHDEDMIEEFLTERDESLVADFGIHDEHMWDFSRAVLERLWNESPNKLNKSAQRVAHARFVPNDTPMLFTLSEVEKAKFTKALAFIQKLGCDHDVDWQFVDPKDELTYGFCRSGKVYICKAAFSNGTQFLAQTMMEEYLHHIKDFSDYSAGFQNFLFAKIISLGEDLHGAL